MSAVHYFLRAADPADIRAIATATANFLDATQSMYHAVVQNFPNETQETCDAGMCGDYREFRDALRLSVANQPPQPDRR